MPVLMTEDSDPVVPRLLRLRYPAVCATCGIALSKGSQAFWDRETRHATCLACAPVPGEPLPGTPGASAAVEGERRRDKRVEKVRRQYGDHAAAVAEEMAGRETDATWGKGSAGESRLAAFVMNKVGDAVIPLHDRLIPGTRGNIDHIFISSTGIWVVDAKAYKGKVVQRENGPIWRRTSEVYVGGRNRSSLANGVNKQVAAVIAALKPDSSLQGIEVNGALCFLDSEWALLDFPFQIGTVWVLYLGALRKRLKKQGALSRETMERIARRLDLSLPPAADSTGLHSQRAASGRDRPRPSAQA
jgi:hypothetical protein